MLSSIVYSTANNPQLFVGMQLLPRLPVAKPVLIGIQPFLQYDRPLLKPAKSAASVSATA
jgi:hypothetical protein